MEQDLSHQEKGNKSKIRRMIMNIYVGNLSYDATDETIR
jgi:RNA recognition motif-containing protein